MRTFWRFALAAFAWDLESGGAGAGAGAALSQMSPLMNAVLNGQPYVVRVLLAWGVDIDRACVDIKMDHRWPDMETISPLAQARRREAVLSMDYEPILADEINSLFDVFLLARLIVAGRRSGPLAARRRALGSKDLTRVIAKFLARKLISEPEQ